MKKLFLIPVLLVIVGALIFGGCPKPAPAEVIELSLNLPTPPTHTRWLEVTEPWTKEIEERTNGQVKIVPYHAEALSSTAENYQSIIMGIADMGECFMGVPPGQFPMWDGITKFVTPSIVMKNVSAVWWEIYKDFPEMQKELEETKLLFLHGAPSIRMATTKKPIEKLDDLKGLKITVTGGGLDPAKLASLGISVESIPLPDFYMACEKGVVDGGCANYELMVSRRWGDVLKHVTNLSLNCNCFYMAMNLDVWNSLPPDVQEVFEEMSGDYAAKIYGEAAWRMDVEAKEYFEAEMGGTSHYLSEAELAKLDELWLSLIDEEVSNMEAQGYPMKKIYQKFLELEKQQSVPWP